MPSVLMRSVSGVRGIVGEGLTPEVLVSHVHSFVQSVGRGRILVGRDTRDSGPAIEDLVCATLALSGCDAVRLGIATTPTVEMAVLADTRAAGGIILTASHNPAEWNALKFLDRDGLFLGPEEVQRAVPPRGLRRDPLGQALGRGEGARPDPMPTSSTSRL
jgi:phosphomannomutase